MRERWLVLGVLTVQAACTVFFVSDVVTSVFGLRTAPISWQAHELLEIGAVLGLVLGLVLGALALMRARREVSVARTRLRRAQGAFQDLLDERFSAWALTPAERDVALFAIKGMSTAEIASLRGTSEGTVKAQTNAIYRKAGVTGRPQLLGVLLDDLTGTVAAPLTEARRLTA